MDTASRWAELTVQHLVRYEALFKLLDEIQTFEEIEAIAKRVSNQWKYFANVTSWRMVVPKGNGFQVVDGFRGEGHVAEVQALSPWDEHHAKLQRPRLIRLAEPLDGPTPPEHLAGRGLVEIEVQAFTRPDRLVGLLSAAALHQPFSDLDKKFIRIFGSHLADRISDILLRRQAMEALTLKATRDQLTGLLSRGTILDRLTTQFALARRTGEPLSVIMVDIDHFKAINDRHGHLVGDEVLREVARCLQCVTRESDSLGRYGGEEFLVVLYPCGAKGVPKAAERFRRSIETAPIPLVGTAPGNLEVTISIGTATTEGRDDSDMQLLIKRADDALYQAKAGGRNRVAAG